MGPARATLRGDFACGEPGCLAGQSRYAVLRRRFTPTLQFLRKAMSQQQRLAAVA
jgi:hypothetical protein